MTRTGTIRLIYKGLETVEKDYITGTHRKKIIDDWKQRYGEKFNECELQIRPDIYERRSYNTSSRLVKCQN
jgi:hypothetical protein